MLRKRRTLSNGSTGGAGNWPSGALSAKWGRVVAANSAAEENVLPRRANPWGSDSGSVTDWRAWIILLLQATKPLECAAEQVIHIAFDFISADLPACLGQSGVFLHEHLSDYMP